jgi:dienelactone hydrolase
MTRREILTASVLVAMLLNAAAGQPPRWRVDGELGSYFAAETARLKDRSLAGIDSLERWNAERPERQRQLFEMLGLQPQPEKTPLHPTITGEVQGDGFRVANIHFQSRPGLYVTGNLYLPDDDAKSHPAVLYVCGHGGVKKDGVSYGNKVHYQHHGAWFARNGYVCLTIDTLQLGEIEGIHHGTYSHDRWWWASRGYTPAGVEAWNCIRAIDYLCSREDVDPERLGVSGRSGGGAYSWWLATTDPRVKVAVPVAGITDLDDHVVRGCVEGHCDCMYMLNTYGWDYYDVAAMVAPRPLLISNTDQDGIFPLRGVVETYNRTAKIYDLFGKRDNIALNITAGPHKDTQELRVHAFRWFNHHLRKTDELIDKPATKFFEPEQLRVFTEIPDDERNTTIDETFVPLAETLENTVNGEKFTNLADAAKGWKTELERLSFRGWPAKADTGDTAELLGQATLGGVSVTARRIETQANASTALLWLQRGEVKSIDVVVVDQARWDNWSSLWSAANGASDKLDQDSQDLLAGIPADSAVAVIVPRGQGPYAWAVDSRKANQIRRRFYLLGQTLDGMRTWDIVQAIEQIQQLAPQQPWTLRGEGSAAGLALYASLFTTPPQELTLDNLAPSHVKGPTYLNVMRFMDIPHAIAMAAERSPVKLRVAPEAAWQDLSRISKAESTHSLTVSWAEE